MNAYNIFWIFVLALVFYVGFKVVPIYYKGLIGIRGVCKENADVFHKYGRGYIHRGIQETLEDIGIPKDQSKHTINITDQNVVINISYWDSTTFFDRYTKEFEFNYQCEGVTKTVYN